MKITKMDLACTIFPFALLAGGASWSSPKANPAPSYIPKTQEIAMVNQLSNDAASFTNTQKPVKLTTIADALKESLTVSIKNLKHI